MLPKSKQKKDRVLAALGIVLTVITIVVLTGGIWWFHTVIWAKATWSELTYQELVYTLSTLTGTNTDLVGKHILECIIPAAIICVIAIIAAVSIYRRKMLLHVVQVFFALAGAACIVIASVWAWDELGVTEYLAGQEEYGSFMDENYVDPATVDVEFPEEKRNLIYIFLESMEDTFADTESGGAFDKNVIPELTKIAQDNEDFSGSETTINGARNMTGTTWTVAAMFAETSGLPLLIPLSDSNSMDLQSEFFPGVTSLGDILGDAGYRQVLLLGSEGEFGGRALYFSQHGDYEIRDYNYYLDNGTLPEGYKVWWGYEDAKLFENAKNTLTELAAGDEPFNLTMLTVDTHFEDGYVCDLCGDEFGDDQYSNVYACSSKQISEFIEWVQEQPFYENTTIVLCGDHITMDNDYCKYVDTSYDRRVYTAIINAPVEYEETESREYSTFDLFPTTLAALGADIPGNRLGLGVNLYSSTKTLLETYGKKMFNEGLNEKSEIMENLTAGIVTEFLDFDTSDYDAETKTLNVTVNHVRKPDNTEKVKAYVWPASDESLRIEIPVTEKDDTFTFTVNFGDFGGDFEKYKIELYAVVDGSEEYLAATNINLGNTSADGGLVAEEAETDIVVGEFDYATGTFPVAVINPKANTIMMSLAVWTKEDQSDLEWLQMNLDENGYYYVSVNAVDFGVINGKYNLHAYATDIEGETSIVKQTTVTIE